MATTGTGNAFKGTLSGDVTIEQTRLNFKGGSMTATLKKNLRAAFADSGDNATGARLDFGDQGSIVLLAPESNSGTASQVKVTRIHRRRFVVDLVESSDDADDALTQAFFSLIIEKFKSGERVVVDRERALQQLDGIAMAIDMSRE